MGDGLVQVFDGSLDQLRPMLRRTRDQAGDLEVQFCRRRPRLAAFPAWVRAGSAIGWPRSRLVQMHNDQIVVGGSKMLIRGDRPPQVLFSAVQVAQLPIAESGVVENAGGLQSLLDSLLIVVDCRFVLTGSAQTIRDRGVDLRILREKACGAEIRERRAEVSLPQEGPAACEQRRRSASGRIAGTR